jgi:hypothetical protein
MAFNKRHFSFSHPTFGRSVSDKKTQPFKNSVYYFWYEFLKRSKDYRECCQKCGSGEMAGLYSDFGDVFELDFKTWWQENDRGVYLFAEEPLPSVRQIKDVDDLETSDRFLNVSLPLELPRRFLEGALKKLLDDHHKGERGIRTNKDSTAKYPVVGDFNRNTLAKCLMVYDLKLQNPDMTLWQLAVQAKLGSPEDRKEAVKKTKTAAGTRMVLANIVSRDLRHARQMIENVGRGVFPGARK